MKTLNLYLIFLVVFVSCKQKQQESVHVSVLADRTDTTILNPEFETIKGFYNNENNQNSKLSFKYLTIGNTDYFRGYSLDVEASSIFGNALQRNANVKKFFTAIDTFLFQENSKEYAYQHSSILTPLINELNSLSHDTVGKRIVLLYSDLSEASQIYNVYSNKRDFYDVSEVTEKIKSQFEIKDLTSIELYILHYPKTTNENKIFSNLCKIYQELFKQSGLTIHIGIDKQLTP